MMVALLAPALWNGYPLIFPDTGGYFGAPIRHALENGRSAFYGAFLDTGIPLSFWPCIAVQAAMTVWLFLVTLRVNGLGERPWLATAIVAFLSIATSLPWFAAQLMPDILFPAAVLALYMLAFTPDRLGKVESYGLAAVIACAVPSHMAAAGLCVAVVLALWLMTFVPRLPLPKPRLTFAAGAVAVGIVLCPVSNLALTGSFSFTPGGPQFLFGRLIEDGIVARYLDDQCPDPSIKLCAYKDELPDQADDWLWGNSPLYKLGGWTGHEAEEKRIIRETLMLYPLDHLATAIAATLNQFASFESEISTDDNQPTFNSFEEIVPQLLPSLMAARQQTGGIDVAPLNNLHVPVAGFAIAAIILALLWRRRLAITPEAAALCLTILIALAANAAICGIFSHPVDRYQSRLVLLAPFAVAVLVARRVLRPHPL